MQKLAASKPGGGECLSKVYFNMHTPLKWRCGSCGYEWETTPEIIKNGAWCPQCAEGITERIYRRFFEALFHDKFKKSLPKWLIGSGGGQMHFDGYNKKLELAFECQGIQHFEFTKFFHKTEKDFVIDQKNDRIKLKLAQKHGINIIYVNWIIKDGKLYKLKVEEIEAYIRNECRKHGIIIPERSRIDWRKFDLQQPEKLKDMERIAESRGGECLSENYVNTNTKLIWRCGTCGHIWKTTPDTIKAGRWCQRCGIKRRANKQKLTIEEMHAIAKKKGGYCLSKKYINSHTKLIWKCGICGNIWKASPSYIKGSKNRKGSWCPNYREHKKILSIDKEKLLKRCQKLKIKIKNISNYNGERTKLKLECKECGYGKEVSWASNKNEILSKEWSGCPQCNESLKNEEKNEKSNIKNINLKKRSQIDAKQDLKEEIKKKEQKKEINDKVKEDSKNVEKDLHKANRTRAYPETNEEDLEEDLDYYYDYQWISEKVLNEIKERANNLQNIIRNDDIDGINHAPNINPSNEQNINEKRNDIMELDSNITESNPFKNSADNYITPDILPLFNEKYQESISEQQSQINSQHYDEPNRSPSEFIKPLDNQDIEDESLNDIADHPNLDQIEEPPSNKELEDNSLNESENENIQTSIDEETDENISQEKNISETEIENLDDEIEDQNELETDTNIQSEEEDSKDEVINNEEESSEDNIPENQNVQEATQETIANQNLVNSVIINDGISSSTLLEKSDSISDDNEIREENPKIIDVTDLKPIEGSRKLDAYDREIETDPIEENNHEQQETEVENLIDDNNWDLITDPEVLDDYEPRAESDSVQEDIPEQQQDVEMGINTEDLELITDKESLDDYDHDVKPDSISDDIPEEKDTDQENLRDAEDLDDEDMDDLDREPEPDSIADDIPEEQDADQEDTSDAEDLDDEDLDDLDRESEPDSILDDTPETQDTEEEDSSGIEHLGDDEMNDHDRETEPDSVPDNKSEEQDTENEDTHDAGDLEDDDLDDHDQETEPDSISENEPEQHNKEEEDTSDIEHLGDDEMNDHDHAAKGDSIPEDILKEQELQTLKQQELQAEEDVDPYSHNSYGPDPYDPDGLYDPTIPAVAGESAVLNCNSFYSGDVNTDDLNPIRDQGYIGDFDPNAEENFDPSILDGPIPENEENFDPNILDGPIPENEENFDPSILDGPVPENEENFDPNILDGPIPENEEDFDPSILDGPVPENEEDFDPNAPNYELSQSDFEETQIDRTDEFY